MPIQKSPESFSGFSSCIVRSMLEELNQLRRDSKTRTLNAPLQKKYDDLENSLNKCKDDLRDLQRKAVTASPSQLRSKYEALGDELKKYKQDLEALHSETQSADSESLQKKYEALQFVLLRYRKDIEDELQKCWTQLKLLHLESQLASPTHVTSFDDGGEGEGEGEGDGESEAGGDETSACKGSETESEADKLRLVPLALERNPRRPRCALLWKPPLPDSRDKTKHYDERKLLEHLTCRKHRLGYRSKPPKYFPQCEVENCGDSF
ncbi:hypothetical protein SELMODRAFT_413974 [Selaginella moellendorffii]|uniref:Uncharacterized protein n=1 Tax=Selaginella moellendorffii TaxID=88036 RepID=D8RR81_SELML|nr:hypothetical protein SELMODRAFT_413974 [Selaginella moellendorffii]